MFSALFKRRPIKVGMLISYDFSYIDEALKIIYPHVDEIILAIDENRMSWSGQKYHFNESFFEKIRLIDADNKIAIFEANFYIAALSPIENETRERNMLSHKMGENCWKLQIDVDEYFLNFESVVDFLNRNNHFLFKPNCNRVNIRANWITLFKKTKNGFLYIDNEEHFSFATNLVGEHFFGRDLASTNNREIYTNFLVLHQSWARDPDEILQKINNWGHKNDFDTQAYFNFWMQVDEHNYHEVTDFHPIYSGAWQSLKFIASHDITSFISAYHEGIPHQEQPELHPKYLKKSIKNAVKFWRR